LTFFADLKQYGEYERVMRGQALAPQALTPFDSANVGCVISASVGSNAAMRRPGAAAVAFHPAGLWFQLRS
jgi:hypothetical protein